MLFNNVSVENQKGVNVVQQRSVGNQKGAIAIDIMQRKHPGSQENIVE